MIVKKYNPQVQRECDINCGKSTKFLKRWSMPCGRWFSKTEKTNIPEENGERRKGKTPITNRHHRKFQKLESADAV